MEKRFLLLICILTLSFYHLEAQSFVFGVKGGPIIGIQQWNSTDRDPLFKYHGIAYLESYDMDENAVALYLQAGYHIRGSAIRNLRFNINNQLVKSKPIEYIFKNVGLSVGAKKKYDMAKGKAYYMLGIRGEYNVGTNFNDFTGLGFSFYPNDFYVRPFVFGAMFGGGIEFPFGELIGGVIELTINPDITRQYIQPAIGNVSAPWDPSIDLYVGERNIRNITLELTVGFRFLRIVEYID